MSNRLLSLEKHILKVMKLEKSSHEADVRSATMNRERGKPVYSWDHELKQFFDEFDVWSEMQDGTTFLDVGCGKGDAVRALSERDKVFGVGIDIWEEERRRSRSADEKRHFDSLFGHRLVCGDCHDMSDHFDDNTFDFAYSYGAFHYLYDKIKTLAEIHRVLKVGKRAVVHIDSDPFGGFRPSLQELLSQQLLNASTELRVFETQKRTVWSLGDVVNSGVCLHQALILKKESDEPLQVPSLVETTRGAIDERVPGLFTECHYTEC